MILVLQYEICCFLKIIKLKHVNFDLTNSSSQFNLFTFLIKDMVLLILEIKYVFFLFLKVIILAIIINGWFLSFKKVYRK